MGTNDGAATRYKAVVDIGTNSVLLLVARRLGDGSLDVERDEARITRLGQGAARSGRLDPEAVRRTVQVLAQYRETADDLGAELVAVATAGLRMVEHRDDFMKQARAALGVDVRLVSGEEEAELSYLSVAAESPPDMPLRVIDIGGGSTELVVGRGRSIEQRHSHPIGSVRLTERWVHTDPPDAAALAGIESDVLAALAAQPMPPRPELHGLAGTVTTAAALLLGLDAYDRLRVDGTRFSQQQVMQLRDALAAVPLGKRCKPPVLPSGRADVIVAGLTILALALQHCGAQTLVVRDRGLRYALV
jgi:exopolyphosphatase/guanosine-5'-triphosphate,3'-diphosphate pyrophosphatase